ncbi:MAG: hypothetical protein H6983_01355 [Ectothiorhodospiraceae bacterium]|nr:hypothetical protein [Ectothiorhodospiraceae bacterium]
MRHRPCVPPAIVARRARVLRAALLGIVLGAIAGCSAVGLAYDNADWLVLRRVDRLVDLDPPQRERLAAALAMRLDRHRREELPAVLAALDRLRGDAADGLTAAEIDNAHDAGRALYERTARAVIGDVVPVLATLGPDQVDVLASELARSNGEYREEHLGASSERAEARRDRWVGRLEDWVGDLDDAQLALVDAALARIPDRAADWLAYREAMGRRLLAALREGASAQTLEAILVRWWVDVGEDGSDFAARRESAIVGWKSLVASLDGTLDDAQRAHLLGRIDDYRRAVRGLMQSREPPSRPRERTG